MDEREELEEREVSVDKLDDMDRMGPGVEFYPVDPLSRGMVDRLRVLNMSLSNMVYLPYEEMGDSPYLRSSQSTEKFQVCPNFCQKPNKTQLNSKQLALELDTVAK